MITSDKYKIHWWGIGANGSATMFWAFTNLFNMPTKRELEVEEITTITTPLRMDIKK